MKRQRSYGDGLDDDRRRFYDRGPPPPPPPRRPPREYDGDRFDRRKGFGGGFHDGRYREYPSPREYGGDRAMHRSESFSGFRREFPKGFRSERDRSRRDGDGSSAWRRPGSGWRDAECFDQYRAPARLGAASLTAQPQRSRSRSRSPSVPRRRRPASVRSRKERSLQMLSLRPDLLLWSIGSWLNQAVLRRSDRSEGRLKRKSVEDMKCKRKMWLLVTQEVKQQEETSNAVDVVEQSTSSSNLNEAIQEEATTREESFNDYDVKKSAPSSFSQGELQEEVTVLRWTGSAAADVGKSTSPVKQQEVLQEEALALDSTACAVHEVGKSTSSGMPQKVLQEEVMRHDGTASAVDRIETDTSSDLLLREATQERMEILDETAHNTDTSEPVGFSGMHEGELTVDATGNTTGVAGQSNSSDVAEDVMHEKAAAQEGTMNAVSSIGESKTFNGLQREEIASLQLLAPRSKEFEKLTVIGEMDKPTKYVALQPAEEELVMDQCEKRDVSKETMIGENEVAVLDENAKKQGKGFDIEANADGARMFHRSVKEHAGDSKEDVAGANLLTRESMAEDKGNGIAFDVLSKKVKVDHSSSVARGLDSALQLCVEPTEPLKSASTSSVKQEKDTMKLGKLDLSLSLSGCLENSEFKCSMPQTSSLVHPACSQLLPSSSFRTNSDGFTAISSTSSQTLGHNPSCSLTQQSLDNYEHSVGSKPFFMGVDQMSNCTGRQAQLSSESAEKGSATPLLQSVLQNDYMPDTNTLAGIKGHNNGLSNDLLRHANIQGVLSPTYSRGSHDSGLEHNIHRRQLTRERSSRSLTRGERQEGEQLVINGAGVIERIISKVVSEPLHLTGRMLQEMTENSITYLREAISDIIVDPDCGLRHSLIRKGQSASRAYGSTEMQFHCAACGHPSEMFGFVKEVFRTCARHWRIETLIRELQGKRVRDFAKQMLIKSENKGYHPEVVKCAIAFFSDDDTNLGINPSVPLKGIPCSIAEAIDGIPSSSRKAAWTPFTLEGLPVLDKTAVLSTTGSPSLHRKSGEAEFATIDNKAVIDELDSLIRLKQAEAYMYQERANDARNEVDNLRRIVMVKNARIKEDYATQIADLDIDGLQERRKRKIEELQVIERTHHEFLSMKTRMESKCRFYHHVEGDKEPPAPGGAGGAGDSGSAVGSANGGAGGGRRPGVVGGAHPCHRGWWVAA
ncbi:protein OBERON 4-like [Panicum miliaceum]|uniref:Protein OBERON 4-like n=1 Tax=Panicum miliaceum TaxID=4540 RepID=A0A3L6TPB3_PANMI|nr:protein OBERON 4-like [Panicum miliaceum]